MAPLITLGYMSLLITPPRGYLSLWQTVCETHGVLARAVRSSRALWIGRLHEFQHDHCTVWVGGLRCMFCFAIVETDRWMAVVQICCEDCMGRVLSDPQAAMVPLALDEFPVLEMTWSCTAFAPRG